MNEISPHALVTFPPNPAPGDIYDAPSGSTYKFDGVAWCGTSPDQRSLRSAVLFDVPDPCTVGARFAYLIPAAQLPPNPFTWLFTGAFLCNELRSGTPTGVWHVELLTDIGDGSGRIWHPITSTNSMAIDGDFASGANTFIGLHGGTGTPENAYFRYDPAIDVQGISWSLVCDQPPTAGAFQLQAGISGQIFG